MPPRRPRATRRPIRRLCRWSPHRSRRRVRRKASRKCPSRCGCSAAATQGEKRDLVYQIADDPTAAKLNFEGLKKALLQKQKDAGERKIRVILERPGTEEDKVPSSSATWIQLEAG